ncbi:hypothetical protein JOD43_004417 [Pullulanibacillus pueri]|uniref:Aspartyl-phosphate phosphatase Spo0E family protein n=1 Tax=Pullulanibacillus pueri TaxID=1437324 RepID=A0A8J2ZZV3_9BACL|nr:aspartyl-phosphate phosphatase Spo0E family protein [Pullulanibacillus pueri]MBM7684202.1 hypothetical protein [Pullulanibacillus pueri]GGH88946.1 hypothetical protein GCM10007096_42430 [Pullulanibacillus pueri]
MSNHSIEIELMRQDIYKLAETKPLTSLEIIHKSQELDKLLNTYKKAE